MQSLHMRSFILMVVIICSFITLPSTAQSSFPQTLALTAAPKALQQNSSYTISGRVTTNTGDGLANINIWSFSEDSATTDTSGSYTMVVAPIFGDTYTIIPLSDLYYFTPASRTFDVPPDRYNQDFVATYYPGHCARFIGDVTYPDGTVVSPGANFEKQWQIENCGTASWSGYQAIRTSGSFGPVSFPISEGTDAFVLMSASFTAPLTLGTYRSTYRLQGPNGQFGDSFWVEIVVQEIPSGSTYSISGKVSTGDGTGIPNVLISAGVAHSTTTDANGQYVLNNLASAYYRVVAHKINYIFTDPVDITLAHQNAIANFRVMRVDSYFRPISDGYQFNSQGWGAPEWGSYPDSPANSDVIPADLPQMFDSAWVCLSSSDPCIVRPEAKRWLTMVLTKTNAGRCLGAAITAQRFFARLDQPPLFQTNIQNTYELLLGNARRNIVYYHVQQWTPDISSSTNFQFGQDLSSTINHIRQGLAGERTQIPTIAIAPRASGAAATMGHAVTPYALTDRGNGRFIIDVYDNADPGKTGNFLEINTQMNEWIYTHNLAISGDWSGTKDTIVAIPNDLFKAPGSRLICPWCSDTSRQIDFAGIGSFYISDAQNKKTGMVNGEILREIPGIMASPTFAGPTTPSEPVYQLPSNNDYILHIRGNDLQASDIQPSSLIQYSLNHVAEVSNIVVSPATDDTVQIAPDSSTISYHANSKRELTLRLMGTYQSIGYTIEIIGADVAANQSIELRTEDGRLAFSEANANGGIYDVRIIRDAPEGTSSLILRSVAIAGGDTQYIDYGAWNGGGAVTFSTDKNSDGLIDVSEQRYSQTYQIYVPLGIR